jgi:hypothetical protein
MRRWWRCERALAAAFVDGAALVPDPNHDNFVPAAKMPVTGNAASLPLPDYRFPLGAFDGATDQQARLKDL